MKICRRTILTTSNAQRIAATRVYYKCDITYVVLQTAVCCAVAGLEPNVRLQIEFHEIILLLLYGI